MGSGTKSVLGTWRHGFLRPPFEELGTLKKKKTVVCEGCYPGLTAGAQGKLECETSREKWHGVEAAKQSLPLPQDVGRKDEATCAC